MKKILLLATVLVFILTSCATEQHDVQPDSTETQNVTVDTSLSKEIDISSSKYDYNIGGTAYCMVHDELYHVVPSWLAELRDANEMYEWASALKIDETKAKSETECPYEYNIKLLIDKFGITVEEFNSVYPITSCGIFDTDILYSGTSKEIDEYFRDLERFSIESKRVGHYNDLFGEIFMAYYDEIYKTSENKDILEYIPVPKLVAVYDINRDELMKYIDLATQKSMETFGVCYTFDYNFDMLYGAEGELIFELKDGVSDKELDEMFCRVGRYAE